MKRRKNPYPYVRKNIVKGHLYWRFEKNGFRCNLPGPYGSPEFLAAYEDALAQVRPKKGPRAPEGTLAWLIEQYLCSLRYQNLSPSRKRTIRLELDWLKRQAGKYHFSALQVRHVEALMARKSGPVAANTVRKNLSMLFNFATKKLGYRGGNPARGAEKMNVNKSGYHTWTDEEVARFLDRHGPGTKARLVMMLALNTGMARQDLVRVGWQHVRNGRIAYQRHKTSVCADMPILDDLARELDRLPRDRMLFVTHGRDHRPYTPASLGNWFRDRCREAGVPGSLHGLRKAGATFLANAGATEWEIASFLAHTDTSQVREYTKKANRSRLTDSGFAKLPEGKMSNFSESLDGGSRNDAKKQ